MSVYRITRAKYAEDLSGKGDSIYGDRWNSKGKPAIYSAGSISLAKLEVTVHMATQKIPKD
ncbi:RES domain-containing protein [Belliella sp. DSM 111904]|uniref:RES domain-containing protein n=1 Tax=Belliella filtrata TaxID=2923435 RepID=A0ABS9V111_9BACT|nr:RES domain-containing protein [Belliella filtrata]MCH7409705.1 RES domain-containing protein [Belliella filtrata]